MFPEECIIYDSRVAYSLNWILLSQNAGHKFFPIPDGRNSKISAFNMDTLIRLKYVHKYVAPDKISLSNKKYISKIDGELYISKERAYQTLNFLIKEIAKRLWVGQKEKCDQLFFTEMLLFSIADREVFLDITKHFSDKYFFKTKQDSPLPDSRFFIPFISFFIEYRPLSTLIPHVVSGLYTFAHDHRSISNCHQGGN